MWRKKQLGDTCIQISIQIQSYNSELIQFNLRSNWRQSLLAAAALSDGDIYIFFWQLTMTFLLNLPFIKPPHVCTECVSGQCPQSQ